MALIKKITLPNSAGTAVTHTFNASKLNDGAGAYSNSGKLYSNSKEVATLTNGKIPASMVDLPYAKCETSATTTAKTVTCANFSLETGAVIHVTFMYDNASSVTTPTLNVNSTGAKSIYYNGAAYADLYTNYVYDLMYNGSQWVVLNPPLVWHTF